MQSISDLDKNMLAQVQEFFVSCNKQRGKKFKVTGTGGPNKAIKFVPKAVDAVRRPTPILIRPSLRKARRKGVNASLVCSVE
jgi:hypothetical protein